MVPLWKISVGPVNNLLHSLFSQVDVSLNGTLITNSTNTYPYRVYLENLLSYGPAGKGSQLTSEMFYKDEAGKCEAGMKNRGLVKRAAFFARSREVDLVGRLHSDIFFQQRYILNEVNTKIKLTRSKDALCLMAIGEQAFRIKLTGAAMLIRKVKISPSVYLAHAKTLESGMAKYPIRRVVCKTFTIPTGNLDVSQEKLFNGQLPSRLILGCIDNRAFNGDLSRNPFNFQHFQRRQLAVYLDGQQIGIKPIAMDYDRGQNVTSYMSLFNGTG